MEINKELNNEFIYQTFEESEDSRNLTSYYQLMAKEYAKVENAIAVLSNLKERKSYMYFGGMTDQFNFHHEGKEQIINSIWEKEIFSLIHTDDLKKRHLQELFFLNFLKGIPSQDRQDYYMTSILRFCNKKGDFVPVCHRIFYVAYQHNGSVWLALCLYNFAVISNTDCFIVNSRTGERIKIEDQHCDNLISEREQEILKLIDRGKKSQEIANLLSISIHTVSRHRQNILEKLQAENSIEACQIAKQLRIIE
jgi:DNA-binding CsgD family transcriptional regulator